MTETLDFFKADEQGNSVFIVQLLFMEYFSSTCEKLMGIYGNGVAVTFAYFCLNGGKPSPEAPSFSCCCHGYETLQRDCGLIFRQCFRFEYLYFDTVHVSVEKKGNVEPIVFILYKIPDI